MGRRMVWLGLLVGAPVWLSWLDSQRAADAANELIQVALALMAAVACFWAGRVAAGPARLVWATFCLGAGLATAAQGLYLAAKWRGIDLLAASPAIYAGWTSLYYVVFVGFYLTAFLRPHQQSGRVRPAVIMDTLLLGQLLLATHFYLLLGYRLGSGGWDRRSASVALTVFLGGGAAAGLLLCWRQAQPSAWRRIYVLLASAALGQAANEAIYVWLRDPLGGIAGRMAAWSLLADECQMLAYALVTLAAAMPATSQQTSPAVAEAPPASASRDLAVPAAVLLGLLGIPLLDSILSATPLLTVESLRLRNAALTGSLSIYIALVLFRQLLIQLENRALAASLQRESQRLKLLVDNIQDAVIAEDLNGGIVFANDRFYELFGLSRSTVRSLRLTDYILPEDRPLDSGTAGGAADHPHLTRFEFRTRRPDGTLLFLESARAPLLRDGVLAGFQSVIRDITDRRNAEQRQRELAQRLEFLVSRMPLACIVFDLAFRIVEWNSSATRIFGWRAAEAVGRNGLELLVPLDQRPPLTVLWEDLAASQSANHRFNQNLTKNGDLIECEWFNTSLIDETGRVAAIASMAQDITERKNLEAQLRQSQKMEVVGTLAGGIAHDFNNLLTPILGHIALARRRLGPNHPADRGLADADRAAARAAELIRQMLGFSRKSPSAPRALSLSDCVRETVALLARTFDRLIVFEVREPAGLWLVDADPAQISQVLTNLCVNARDAMPEGGQLTISVANRTLDPDFCRTRPEARPGEFVEVKVSDTGAGMDAATRARIFEPFFTTKEVGKGTGLGLSMVYGIVQQHGGWVTVESGPGHGSVFSFFLPRSTAPDQREAKPQCVTPGGSETILLVDDHEMILKLARRVLENKGHRVLEARDGEEAIKVFREVGERVDLVLLEMALPRKSGRETLAELHRLAPQLRVVLISCCTPVESSEELAGLGARGFLRKPYGPTELARVVREALDPRPEFQPQMNADERG